MLVPGCRSERPAGAPADIEQENYRAAVRFSNARNGFAVLVMEEGRVAFEDYHGELNLWQRG